MQWYCHYQLDRILLDYCLTLFAPSIADDVSPNAMTLSLLRPRGFVYSFVFVTGKNYFFDTSLNKDVRSMHNVFKNVSTLPAHVHSTVNVVVYRFSKNNH